ncbi:putative reverse transcriptase domain-containing protein [Tanacetum coccineum]
MNRVCKPYLDKFVIVFIDDILIYLKSKEDHEVHLKLVLELLKKEKLFAKFYKCEFWLQEVHFLGHMVNNNGIHVDPSKIKVVKNRKAPKTPSKIRSLLGLAKEDFHMLKDNLCNAPILSLTDGSEDFVIYCDASNQGLRCVLMQRGKSSIKDKLLAAQYETSKEENALAKMLRDLDQQKEKKEDGGADKMYYDLRDMYWWPGMKKDIATYVKLVQETTNKVVLIKKRLEAANVRQKSYVDNRHKPLEFEVCDQVLLKVSPCKGPIDYRLGLSREPSSVHDTFHVLNMKNYLADANTHVPLEEIKVDKGLYLLKKLVEIMDRKVKNFEA